MPGIFFCKADWIIRCLDNVVGVTIAYCNVGLWHKLQIGYQLLGGSHIIVFDLADKLAYLRLSCITRSSDKLDIVIPLLLGGWEGVGKEISIGCFDNVTISDNNAIR